MAPKRDSIKLAIEELEKRCMPAYLVAPPAGIGIWLPSGPGFPVNASLNVYQGTGTIINDD